MTLNNNNNDGSASWENYFKGFPGTEDRSDDLRS